jgi:23S rRNA (adenine1618-N6)-methyltransferase
MTKSHTFHPKNLHQGSYDFDALVEKNTALKQYVHEGKSGRDTIDFNDAKAVKELNKSLLISQYKIENWNIPEGYLCPPVPGRADYIHHISDLLTKSIFGNSTQGNKTTCLDIGAGANCIYPIIGISAYNWSFIASETDKKAIQNIEWLKKTNKALEKNLEIRIQENGNNIFTNIIRNNDIIDCTICNPPFYASKDDAIKANTRKRRNLSGDKKAQASFNFGGNSKELWYNGGEVAFIKRMIKESRDFANNVFWFTTLVSSEKHLPIIKQALHGVKVTESRVIELQQGNKKSRIVAWSFLNEKVRKAWSNSKK